jgi:hypothetical protein
VTGFDLLNPVIKPGVKPRLNRNEFDKKLKIDRAQMVAELTLVCKEHIEETAEEDLPTGVLATLREIIETLSATEQLATLEHAVKEKYAHVFDSIPHLDELPSDVYCRICLKDPSKTIATRSYSTPRKYKEVWAQLIQQHLDAGRICPSNSKHASPAFIIPKADTSVLPRWVNDYRILNSNTVTDSHPLPRVDDILSDCADMPRYASRREIIYLRSHIH